MSSKPVDTIQLLLALIGLIKSAAVAMSVIGVEWALQRKAHAEKKAIIAKNDVELQKKINELREESDVQDPISTIDNIIAADGILPDGEASGEE